MNMKLQWQWVASILPVLIGIALVFVLDEFHIIEVSYRPADVYTVIIFGGLIVTIVFVFLLISREIIRRIEIVSIERARAEANAERARFLRRLDHELKNPLMGINIALANLGGSPDAAQLQRIHSDIEMQVTRLNRLVTDLRKFADLGSQPLEIQTVDLDRLLHEIEYIVTEEAGTARTLTFQIPDALPTISGDYDLLMIALYNLMSNALKFTRPGDTISLQAHVDDNNVMIEVHDTGQGIATKDLPYIWDELYRGQTAKGVPGSGIGLSLIKLIIERHGGAASAQSQRGQGTTMTICLPITHEAPPQATAISRLKSALWNKRT